MIHSAALLLASALPVAAPAPPAKPVPPPVVVEVIPPSDLVAEPTWPMYQSLYSFPDGNFAEVLGEHYYKLSKWHEAQSEIQLHLRDIHLELAFKYSQLQRMTQYLKTAQDNHRTYEGCYERDYYVRQMLEELRLMVGDRNFNNGHIWFPHPDDPKPRQ